MAAVEEMQVDDVNGYHENEELKSQKLSIQDSGTSSGDNDGAKRKRAPKRKKQTLVQGGKLLAEAFSKTLQQTNKKDLKVLAKSHESLKREREEQEETKEAKRRAKARREIVTRGRQNVPDIGEDPNHDQREKHLRKLATRGVVRLFNMVAKFKKQESLASDKAAKNKKRFLSEMRKPLDQEDLGPTKKKANEGAEKKKAGWAALKDSFTGLEGDTKDWDQFDSDDDDGSDQESDKDSGDTSEDSEGPQGRDADKSESYSDDGDSIDADDDDDDSDDDDDDD